MMLTRPQYSALTKLDAESLKSMARREQLPFMSVETMDLAEGQRRPRNHYTAMDALLTIMMREFVDEMGLLVGKAGRYVAAVAPALQSRWSEIASSSENLFRGITPEAEIFAGIARLALNKRGIDLHPLVGTWAEIAEQTTEAPAPCTWSVLTNASRSAAVMRMRALRHDIDLGDFFRSGG